MDTQLPPTAESREQVDGVHLDAVDQEPAERGQGMVEYAFILMLVFLVVILSVQVLGHQTQHLYSNISNGFVGH